MAVRPDHRTLLDLRGRGARLVDSTRLGKIKEGPERRAAVLAAEGIDAINMHHTDWSGGLVALFHRFDRVAFGWDMQHEHVLSAALRMGLDGVYSDWVDRMVDAYTAELGPPAPAVTHSHCQSLIGQITTKARPTRSPKAI